MHECSSIINEKAKTIDEKKALIEKLLKINIKSECINKSLNALVKVYIKK